MKQFLNKDGIKKLYRLSVIKSRRAYRFAKQFYLSLNMRQRIVLCTAGGAVVLLLIIVSVSSGPKKIQQTKYPVRFENKAQVVSRAKPVSFSAVNNNRAIRLQSQLNQLSEASVQHYNRVKAQLEAIQSNMQSVASQRDFEQLKQAISQPNNALLGKVDSLQNSVKTIIQQTAKKTWIDSKTVEKYFRLVAIQGFSDGMRTIIDIDGNQTTLSVNEICPACRGWMLNSMNFSNQSAVFVKQADNQLRYVRLRTNS